MKIIKLFALLIALPFALKAQTERKQNVVRYFTHSHGISYQKFDNINNRIKTYPQYEQIKNTTGTLQIGIMTERNKLILNYLATVGTSLSGDKEKRSTATRFVAYAVDLGYYLYKGKRISFYPLLGLGIENFTLVLNRDNAAVPFDSYVSSSSVRQSTEPLKLANTFLTYRLGAGGQISSKKHPKSSFGLQAVYAGSFKDEEWKINTTQITTNSPKDKLSKILVQLLLRYQL